MSFKSDSFVHQDEGPRNGVNFTQQLGMHLSSGTLRLFAMVTHLGNVGTLTVLCVVVAAGLLYAKRHAWA